jgi:dTMP kinase
VTQQGPPPDPSPAPKEPEQQSRSAYGMVLRLRNFRRLWIAMGVASLGDWVGMFALLAMTSHLSDGDPLAVAGLMIFRVLPAFLVGPLAGVLLDRIDRRKAMVVANIVRACLMAAVPFVPTLPMLYAISFLLEVATLVWLPAKDALIPSLVPKRLLVATNSLALFTTYGVFPLGALVFVGLVGVASFLGGTFAPLEGLGQENLAFWINACTFIASAIITSRIRVPDVPRQPRPLRLGVLWEELKEGLEYLRDRGEIARVMRSIAVALAGGAVVFSLGSPYAIHVLGGGSATFGGIVAALGIGMGIGVLVLGFIGDRYPKAWLAASAVILSGVLLGSAGLITSSTVAMVIAGAFGAGAGVAYASLFALLQEIVHESVRGRTFAAVQVVIRTSIFASLVIFPALASIFSTTLFGGVTGDGVRLALAAGGLVTCAAGLHAAWDVYKGKIKAPPISTSP